MGDRVRVRVQGQAEGGKTPAGRSWKDQAHVAVITASASLALVLVL